MVEPADEIHEKIKALSADADVGSRLDVWDMDSKKVINHVTTDRNHRLDTNAIWSRDEQHLIAFRLFTDSEPDRGAELYVPKLRD